MIFRFCFWLRFVFPVRQGWSGEHVHAGGRGGAGQRVPVMAYIMNPELHLKPSLPPRDYYLGIKTGYEQNGLPVGCLKYAFKNCLKECGMEPYPKKVQTKPPQRKEASHER